MIQKMKSNAGETIAEVLVASLVAVLGVLLFAMMVQSSFQIITQSDKKMKDIYAAESSAEAQGTVIESNKTLTISPTIVPNQPSEIKVDIYGSKNESIISYKKK